MQVLALGWSVYFVQKIRLARISLPLSKAFCRTSPSPRIVLGNLERTLEAWINAQAVLSDNIPLKIPDDLANFCFRNTPSIPFPYSFGSVLFDSVVDGNQSALLRMDCASFKTDRKVQPTTPCTEHLQSLKGCRAVGGLPVCETPPFSGLA